MIKQGLIAFSLILITSACTLNQVASAPTQPNTPFPSPPASEVALDASLQNEGLGIEFDYPADWTVEASAADYIAITSYTQEQITQEPFTEAIPAHLTKIEFYLAPAPDRPKTAESYLAELSSPDNIDFLAGEAFTIQSGLPALRLQFKEMRGDGTGRVDMVSFIAHDRWIDMVAFGGKHNLEAIARTIREIDSGVNVADMSRSYTNEELGYQFYYPDGWWVDAGTSPDSAVILFSTPRDQMGAGNDGVPSDQTKIDFIPNHQGNSYRTIDGFIELWINQSDQEGPGGRLDSYERFTINNIPALKAYFTGGMGGDVMTIVLDLNGRLLHITAYGDIARFMDIVSTLQLIR